MIQIRGEQFKNTFNWSQSKKIEQDFGDIHICIETHQEMVDRELNPEGSEFKPLRAIYDPAFEVSDNAVVQDNVEKCIAVIEGRVRTKKVAK